MKIFLIFEIEKINTIFNVESELFDEQKYNKIFELGYIQNKLIIKKNRKSLDNTKVLFEIILLNDYFFIAQEKLNDLKNENLIVDYKVGVIQMFKYLEDNKQNW